MKKSISVLLAIVMMVSMVACGTSAGNATEPVQVAETAEQATEAKTVEEVTTAAEVDPEAEKKGGVLDIAIYTDPGSIDPHAVIGAEMYKWASSVYETPLSYDASGNLCPNVCDFELSEDGKTLKLWVRDGMTFHDGSTVEIEDVVASLERCALLQKDMKTNVIDIIESLDVKDGNATYIFSKYNPKTVDMLCSFKTIAAVMPKEICEKYGADTFTDVADVIGTGPYKLAKYTPSIGYEMERYDGYAPVPEGHDGEAGPKKAYLDKINLWINTDNTSRFTALLNGEYDVVNDVQDENYIELMKASGYEPVRTNSTKTFYMAFNTKGTRSVNDANLRKAIASMLDQDSCITINNAVSTASKDGSPLPTSSLYYNDKFEKADYVGAKDIELAKKYLAESNYNGEEIVILAFKFPDVCTVLEQDLKELGLNAKIVTMDTTAGNEFVADPNNAWDVIFAGATQVSAHPALLPKALVDTYWGSERKDELMKALKGERYGSAESLAQWDELSSLWIDDAAVVCVYDYSMIDVHHKDLVHDNPCNYFNHYYNMYWVNPSEHMN